MKTIALRNHILLSLTGSALFITLVWYLRQRVNEDITLYEIQSTNDSIDWIVKTFRYSAYNQTCHMNFIHFSLDPWHCNYSQISLPKNATLSQDSMDKATAFDILAISNAIFSAITYCPQPIFLFQPNTRKALSDKKIGCFFLLSLLISLIIPMIISLAELIIGLRQNAPCSQLLALSQNALRNLTLNQTEYPVSYFPLCHEDIPYPGIFAPTHFNQSFFQNATVDPPENAQQANAAFYFFYPLVIGLAAISSVHLVASIAHGCFQKIKAMKTKNRSTENPNSRNDDDIPRRLPATETTSLLSSAQTSYH